MHHHLKVLAPVALLLAAIACTCGPLNTVVEGAVDAAEMTAQAQVEEQFGNLDATLQAEVEQLEIPEELPTAAPNTEATGLCEEIPTAPVADAFGVSSVEGSSQGGDVCVLQAPDFSQVVTVTRTPTDSAQSAQSLVEAQTTIFAGEEVAGLGDQAVWLPELGTLVVRDGTTVYLIAYVTREGLGTESTVPEAVARLIVNE